MRMIVIKDATDLQGLGEQLLRRKGRAGDSERAMARLEQLNPHVDFRKIEQGTVLLVPDLPAFRIADSSPIAAEAFAALRTEVLAGVDAVTERIRNGHAALAVQQKEVTTAFRSAAFQRALEADPELKAQADAANDVFKQDQTDAKAADEALKVLRDVARTELSAIEKLLS